ncbi:alpha/beta-hydrolase [Xylaria longipes]|nr:alpha/beta-hydrolase [Xylaria longipes]
MLGSEPSYHRLQSPEAAAPRSKFYSKFYSKFRQRRIRWALGGVLVFGTITIILLSTLLTRHSTGGLDTLFKKTSTLTLNQGKYVGQVIGPSGSSPRAIQAYLGVPYAQSTAGKNRFRPPQPLEHSARSDTTYHALKYGQICPQGKPGIAGHGENCLNANIYLPHFGDDAEAIAEEEKRLGVDSTKLPVVAYVHGGAFNMGSGKERNMASFAAFADSPIVALSFNYRVGPLGFLPSSVTAKQGLLNLGLKDQQFFFEWMRNILPDLGGDPNNVTIMGLSAGSHSIGHHLISYAPANKLIDGPPPFQKAIIESGGSTARAVFVPDHPLHEQQFKEFLTKCGILEVYDNDKLFDKLRDLPYNTVVSAGQAMWKTWSDTLRWPFQPVIDGPGGVIPDLPINSWRKGNVLRIPILTGFNTNEGATFVPKYQNQPTAVNNLMKSIIPALNNTDLNNLNTLYPSPSTTKGKALYANAGESNRFGTEFWRLDDAYAHYAYICPVLQTAHFASTAEDAGPVYVYHFAARSASYGAADHADETPVVTHDVATIGSYPGLLAVADAMTGAWSRFAVTGDPNLSISGAKAAFTWPRYYSPLDSNDADSDDEDAGRVALFGDGNDERIGAAGSHNAGTPAKDVALTERTKTQCHYWWPRVVLSEGWANGSTSFIPENKTFKAKL